MAIPKPTFNALLSHYPIGSGDFGSGGEIIDNPAFLHTCALRLSTALETAIPGFLEEFPGTRAVHLQGPPGHRARIVFPYARGAPVLARYLLGSHVGWHPVRLNSRAAAQHLGTQGIIFWQVKPGSDSPNHIDLWDPAVRTLTAAGGRSMLWAPAADIVEYAWFWELARGGAMSPPMVRHSLQSGP